jgi:hypothetical protein
LGLLFVATTILYIDRSALGILAPELQKSIGWSEEQYGMINTVFMIAYAICFIVMGRLIDTIGTRKGYLVSICIWSLATLGHALARSIGFAVARFSLLQDNQETSHRPLKLLLNGSQERPCPYNRDIQWRVKYGNHPFTFNHSTTGSGLDNWRIGFLWTFPLA